MKFLLKKWYLIVAGIFLTAEAVSMAYEWRGYFACGGEWLILPVILLAALLADSVRRELPNIRKLFMECEEEA